MMVAILNFICDTNCAQQNRSILVKSILYHVKLIWKMFPHTAVISVQSEFKENSPSNCLLFPQCISLIFWVHVFQMLWPIVYCSSHFGVCHGRSFTTDITDMWMNEVVLLMLVQIGKMDFICEVRYQLSAAQRIPERRPMWLVLLSPVLCCLLTTLYTVEIDNLTANRQDVRSDGQTIGVKSQKGDLNDSDQWCYQQCLVWFGYNLAHSGNWQIWLPIFNAQDCPCEALGHVHEELRGGALVINHGSYIFKLTNFPYFSRSKGAPVVWRGALPMSVAFKVAFLDITIK